MLCCSAACRLRHPEKHAQCVATLLHKFMRLRPILPKFVVESVKAWRESCPILYQDMPQVGTFPARGERRNGMEI